MEERGGEDQISMPRKPPLMPSHIFSLNSSFFILLIPWTLSGRESLFPDLLGRRVGRREYRCLRSMSVGYITD